MLLLELGIIQELLITFSCTSHFYYIKEHHLGHFLVNARYLITEASHTNISSISTAILLSSEIEALPPPSLYEKLCSPQPADITRNGKDFIHHPPCGKQRLVGCGKFDQKSMRLLQ